MSTLLTTADKTFMKHYGAALVLLNIGVMVLSHLDTIDKNLYDYYVTDNRTAITTIKKTNLKNISKHYFEEYNKLIGNSGVLNFKQIIEILNKGADSVGGNYKTQYVNGIVSIITSCELTNDNAVISEAYMFEIATIFLEKIPERDNPISYLKKFVDKFNRLYSSISSIESKSLWVNDYINGFVLINKCCQLAHEKDLKNYHNIENVFLFNDFNVCLGYYYEKNNTSFENYFQSYKKAGFGENSDANNDVLNINNNCGVLMKAAIFICFINGVDIKICKMLMGTSLVNMFMVDTSDGVPTGADVEYGIYYKTIFCDGLLKLIAAIPDRLGGGIINKNKSLPLKYIEGGFSKNQWIILVLLVLVICLCLYCNDHSFARPIAKKSLMSSEIGACESQPQ